MDGILNIHKAVGMTSHDVVARVRKLLHQKRVGHAGTLDPSASGVLPICVGYGTRVAEYLSESGKAYQARITFGMVTDSYDAEGTVLRTADISSLTLAQIESALPHFLGPQQQYPPRYSAIKLQGQPAYKRMRAGEEVTLASRPIEIFQLDLLSWQSPELLLDVSCSKGTYIRSLAYDLGEYLGCGAYLSGLVRTRSGPFTLEESVTLEHLAEALAREEAASYLYPADYALQEYPALYLDASTSQSVLHGNPFVHPDQNTQPQSGLARIYDHEGLFLAIAIWDADRSLWQPHKVLVSA